MIDALILWSLRYRYIVVVLSALLLVWGAIESARMPVDVFPDLSSPTVTIVTEAHGMAPVEVENGITRPIESALNGAPGIRRVRSNSAVGLSVVWAEFDWDHDLTYARAVVAERLQHTRDALPEEIGSPQIAPMASIMGEILFFALSSEKHGPMEIRTWADTQLRPRLLAVSGISQVIPIGGQVKQFQVHMLPDRLAAHGISAFQVAEALRRGSDGVDAGFIVEGGQEFLIQGYARATNLEEVGEILVANIDDRPVLVRHIAELRIGPGFQRGLGSHLAQSAVIIGVQKQPGANTLELTRRLEKVVEELRAGLPAGMKLDDRVFRQADFIETAVDNVVSALRDGAILVILVIMVFLVSWRATLITVLAIPLSLVTAIITMKFMGVTLNTMTLGGLAIAIGALVDDAIIDVENVSRRLRLQALLPESERLPLLEVVYAASKEIRKSIVFATLIILLVFVPLFFLDGIEGLLLRPLGFAYGVSLAASLFVALTLTPALCAILLTGSKRVAIGEEGRVILFLKRIYEPVLLFALPRRNLITSVSLLLLLAASLGFWRAGRSFLPEFNEGTLTINVVTLPGTSLAASDLLGQRVEQLLMRHPEVVSTGRRVGRAELDDHAQDVFSNEIEVRLEMGKRGKDELLAAVRADLAGLTGANITIGQPISHRIDHILSGTRAAIAVKIFGPDSTILENLATRAKSLMQAVPGAVDINFEQPPSIPTIEARLDRVAIARHGLTIEEVSHTLEMVTAGYKAGELREGINGVDLVLRYAGGPFHYESLADLGIQTPSGASVPLKALVQFSRGSGPNSVQRENGQRKFVLFCNVAGRDLGSVVSDIQTQLGSQLKLPEGYRIEYGGQFESAGRAAARLFGLSAVALLLIGLLLWTVFDSVREALLVLLNLPLALIGGVFGVWFTGGIISIASIIGFITLFGIATRNGILLVTHFKHLKEVEGVLDPLEVVRRGSLERLVPILMTAITAALALVPLTLKADQPGGEIEAPMAVVILCGLVSSTLLNLVVVPALYLKKR